MLAKQSVTDSKEHIPIIVNLSSQSVTDSFFVFTDLPLVYPIINKNNTTSLTE